MDNERLENHSVDLTQETLFSYFDASIHYDYFKAYRRAQPINPEVSLFLAVLENGIETYCKYLGDRSRRGQRLFEETEEWFFNRDEEWICSFENVCAVTSINADYVRRGLRLYKQTHSNPDSCVDNLSSRVVKNAA